MNIMFSENIVIKEFMISLNEREYIEMVAENYYDFIQMVQ